MSGEQNKKVTVVVVTWNALKYTQTCFTTLQENTDFPHYDLIVVDNGSTDGTREYLQSLPRAKVIYNERNLGFARANNLAIRAADPESDIVLLNNDVEIYQRDWLSQLQSTAHTREDWGIVGCRLCWPDGILQHAGAYMPIETWWGQQIGAREKDVNQYNSIREVEAVVFACVYIRRDVIDRVGLIDERYFAYFEDTDFCFKAKRAGYKTVCCGAVTLVHHQNVSTQVNNVDFFRLFGKSQKIFKKRWQKFLREQYQLRLTWHSTVSRPIGYALQSRAMMLALEEQKVYTTYQYVYGKDSPIPLEEPRDANTGDYRLNCIRLRQVNPRDPQVVFGQGDVLQKNFGAYKVGFTMLEVNGLPQEWVRQLNLMDEVWVPSPFNLATFCDSGVVRPIHVVPLGVDPNYYHAEITGYPIKETFAFLTVLEWGERKAPEVLLKAFNEEFKRTEDALLIVKAVNSDPGVDVAAQIHRLGLRPEGGRIEFVVNRLVPPSQMGSLYRSADCFVLPTRGEGWGMPILEAMACGLPVIATDWSAQSYFMHADNAYPLRVKQLIPAVAKCPYYHGFQWADPDEEHLRYLLRYVYEHREEARQKGRQAAEEVRQKWTWAHTASRMIERLEQITTVKPPRRFFFFRQTTSSQPLRVGIDMCRTPGEKTGLGVYTTNLVEGLAAVDAVTEYTLYPGFGVFLHPRYGKDFDLTVPLQKNFKKYTGKLPAFADQNGRPEDPGVDIVHSTSNVAPAVGRAKLLMTVHDLTFHLFPVYHTEENIRLCETQFALARERAVAFIAVSEQTKKDLMQIYGIPESMIKVIYQGVSPCFAPVREDERRRILEKYGLRQKYVLFVGSVEPRKNLKTLVHAYHALTMEQEDQSHCLVVAGAAGWLNSDVYALVKDLGLQDKVKFLGYVPDGDLPALYSGATVFVYPSFYEGFGLPVLEAMSCGAPAITSNVSSLPEVAGDAGLLVDPRDTKALYQAVKAVLQDESLRASLSDRSLRRARLFSQEQMARETLALYKEVAAMPLHGRSALG